MRLETSQAIGNICSAEFNKDGTRVLIGETNGSVSLWNVELTNPQLSKSIFNLDSHQSRITITRFLNDDQKVVTAAEGEPAVIWPTNGWSKEVRFRP